MEFFDITDENGIPTGETVSRSDAHDETKLVLQTEEVEEVKWFDIEDVREGCKHRDGTLCVPTEGLETIMKYLANKE